MGSICGWNWGYTGVCTVGYIHACYSRDTIMGREFPCPTSLRIVMWFFTLVLNSMLHVNHVLVIGPTCIRCIYIGLGISCVRYCLVVDARAACQMIVLKPLSLLLQIYKWKSIYLICSYLPIFKWDGNVGFCDNKYLPKATINLHLKALNILPQQTNHWATSLELWST